MLSDAQILVFGMQSIVYASNSFLIPMLSRLHPDWQVLRAWDNIMETTAVTALATTVWDPIDKHYLARFPRLEVICHLGLGVDNLDVETIGARGIQLLSQPQAGIHDTAELAMALLLGLTRKISLNDQYVRAGKWLAGKPKQLGHHLLGKRVGLLGYGQIGQMIGKFLQPFGVEISYCARQPKSCPFTYVADLETLARESDYLIVCCTGGESTRHLVDTNVLAALGEKGYLINVARGSVVDEKALLTALQSQKIAGAALDVYSSEPGIDPVFYQLDNVVLSPHMGSSTHENLQAMFALQAAQLNGYLLEKDKFSCLEATF